MTPTTNPSAAETAVSAAGTLTGRPLTERIRANVDNPLTDDEFEPGAALDGLLGGVGLSSADCGGAVSFVGADPVVPSTLRLGGVAAVALAAKSVALAALHRDRGGDGQDIHVDIRRTPHRLCPFYDQKWELVGGYPPAMYYPSPFLSLAFHQARDGRWLMPMNPYPKLRYGAEAVLGAPESDVARAIARRDAAEIEEAGCRAGVVMPMVRTPHEWLATEQHAAAARSPLITLRRIGDAPPEPLPPVHGGDLPLAGVRALGMGHVIAGAGTGRALALHGADVLNIWQPREYEEDFLYQTANVGVRSAKIDARTPEGARLMATLLADADVFFANRRPGYLAGIGLSADEAAATRPGIVHASISLHGTTGPWADRVGFDQTAGALVGMMSLEGGSATDPTIRPSLPPILVVNDYILSWLATVGIVEALRRRSVEGGSWSVEVSLVRAALWVLELGVFDLDYARAVAGRGSDHAYLDPETFTADTPMGSYQGVTDQVLMTRTPGRYDTVLVPRGSSRPEWLASARSGDLTRHT